MHQHHPADVFHPQGEELDEAAEQVNPHEYVEMGRYREVEYNEKVPPEFFDFIVIDECHRSIYNLWKQVLDYDYACGTACGTFLDSLRDG